VVKGGRSFLRRLIDFMCKIKAKHHHARIDASSRADITWWANYIALFNGTLHFTSVPVPAAHITSDACIIGGAATFNKDWFYVNWSLDFPKYADSHINIKELYTIVLAVKKWAHLWRNQHVLLYTDSKCAMYMINGGSSRSTIAMHMLRELFWITQTFNCYITARHIAGELNICSDYISRLDKNIGWQFKLHEFDLLQFDLSRHMSLSSFEFLQEKWQNTKTIGFS